MSFDPAVFSALAAALVPIALCVAMGVAIGNGRARWPGSDMFVGFGIMVSAISMLAVATRLPLSSLMLGLAAIAVMVPLCSSRASWRGRHVDRHRPACTRADACRPTPAGDVG
jgi:hypothetical protein